MRSASKWIERCLWTIGLFALSAWLTVWIGARVHQALGKRELDRRLAETSSENVPSPSAVLPSIPKLAKGDLIGRIEIPRLDLSTVIFEGTDDDVLRDGVGHLTGSPLPGQEGNVVLAAHRDTFFRPLRYVRNHDTIDVVTPAGTKTYQVFSTTVVTPDHTEVIAPTRGPVLTLVTCYPFDWFGHAPKRFIVKAREVDDRQTSSASLVNASIIPAAPPAPSSTQAASVMETVDHPAPPQPKPVHRATHRFRPYVPIAAAPKAEAVPQVETDVVGDDIAPDPASGNRILRGLKKLNPKGLFSKLAGN